MELTTIWFTLIAVLFTGYFILEGFDFGVGILIPVLGRDNRERRAMINTIGPVWDGNEVWIITAGGAMFAAFPHWYASLFSGFYLLLFAILIGLIIRGVAFEYRGKGDTDRWRRNWDACLFLGSAIPAFFWGVVVANLVRGVPLDANFDYTGSIWGLLNVYALLGGLTTLLLFTTHGAYFLHLRTTGDLSARARALALKLGVGDRRPGGGVPDLDADRLRLLGHPGAHRPRRARARGGPRARLHRPQRLGVRGHGGYDRPRLGGAVLRPVA